MATDVLFFLGIQRRRLAPKVEPGEARFGPELDWEKPWRDPTDVLFFLGFRGGVWHPKWNQGRLVLDQN